MITITLNAFSFLRKKLIEQNIPYHDNKMLVKKNTTPSQIIKSLGYLEFTFINGKVMPMDTMLNDGDRIALVPPGTPGSYRLILGAKKVDA